MPHEHHFVTGITSLQRRVRRQSTEHKTPSSVPVSLMVKESRESL